MRRVILLIALIAASACASARLDDSVKPDDSDRPALPDQCDPQTLDGRAGQHRYEHCLEQMSIHQASTIGAQMFTLSERSFQMNSRED